jgi:hypothetical protein
MPAEFEVKSLESITNENIVEIFRLFCKAFEIKSHKDDEKFLRRESLDLIKDHGGIDYRPYMGAKFFGQKFGNTLQFHGYSDPEDPNYELKDKKFQELVKEYLVQKKFIGIFH